MIDTLNVVKTKQQEIEEYFNTEAVSQSLLKRLNEHPSKVHNFEFKNTSYLDKGNCVDMIITDPESVKYNFFVVKKDKPSETIMKIVKNVYEDICFQGQDPREVSLSDYSNAILSYCLELNYGKSWKDDTKVRKVVEGGEHYFTQLIESEGRVILTNEEYANCQSAAANLMTNEFTSKYIKGYGRFDVIFQHPLYWVSEVNGVVVPCKALLDIMLVDNLNMTIQPVDIKTVGYSPDSFKYSAKKFRYDIQDAWYTKALEHCFPEYDILPFLFIVESVEPKFQGNPLVFQLSKFDKDVGCWGMCKEIKYVTQDHVEHRLVEYKGCQQLLQDYVWHKETEFWTHTHEHYEQLNLEGKINLKLW